MAACKMVLASVTLFDYAFSLNLDSPMELGIWVKMCENQLRSGKKDIIMQTKPLAR